MVLQATASKCDVRIKADVDAAISTAVKHFGSLDIAVANAGEELVTSQPWRILSDFHFMSFNP